MKLSKYVLKIPYKSKIILYNTVNDMIVLCDYKDFLNKKSKELLKANGFFDNDNELLQKYMKQITKKRTQLDITISLTEGCNLCCKYCSQSTVKKNSYITKEVLDDIVEYVKICIKNYGYKSLSIHLFGGEPLLMQKEILYLNDKLEKLSVPVNYYMDTNSVLLKKEFISKLNNITFCITLSEKSDHDNLRITEGNIGTYDIIMKNIRDVQDVLDVSHKMMIRYNVNHLNINRLEEFLKKIKDFKITDIVVAYTDNYDNNVKTNELSYMQYKKWNSTKVIPLLIKYGYPVELPTSSYYCKGYERYSLKVFSDGRIGMCNAYDINKTKTTLNEIIEDYKKTHILKESFKEERNLSNVIDNQCKKCKYLYICNGKYFCREKPCEFLDYDIEKYIKTYVENTLK